MARILCITDNPHHVEMFADMLKRRGHDPVQTMVPPLDLAAVDIFAPEIVMVSLARKVGALRGPIVNFQAEVDGAKGLGALLAHWHEGRPLLILTGIAVEEADLPDGLEYDAFVHVPQQLDRLLSFIDQADVKSSLGRH